MEKIKAISSLLEPFILATTFIGFGATVATKNYNYLAIPSVSSIPIVALSRLKSKDDIKKATDSRERKIEKLRFERDINKQNKTIEKLNQQVSDYQKQLSQAETLLDSKVKEFDRLYTDREQTLQEYQARISELEQKFDIETLCLEAEISQQNETIEKLGQQLSDYQKQLGQTEVVLDSKVRDLEKQASAYQGLEHLYTDREKELKEYQARIKKLEQTFEFEKLRLKGEISKQNEIIEKLNKQIADYQKQLSETKDVSDPKINKEKTLKEYQAKIGELEKTFDLEKLRLKREISKQNEVIERLNQQVSRYQKQLDEAKILSNYTYDLIFDRFNSREVLIEALTKSQEQLILVCPWLTEHGLDDQIQILLINLLKKGVKVYIGWGYSHDLYQVFSNEADLLNPKRVDFWKYKKVPELKRLQKQYHNLNLRLLGTHEKYLVCDRKFAMISSHNFLTSGDSQKEREVSLKNK
ncbi:MAG: hypothetical protein HC918_00195 [Oscillatoriales cyanobacterium SM2_1_8]|nr:hypothetical protein [Oscillatoriales cyanobacterium SM2_1_8]